MSASVGHSSATVDGLEREETLTEKAYETNKTEFGSYHARLHEYAQAHPGVLPQIMARFRCLRADHGWQKGTRYGRRLTSSKAIFLID